MQNSCSWSMSNFSATNDTHFTSRSDEFHKVYITQNKPCLAHHTVQFLCQEISLCQNYEYCILYCCTNFLFCINLKPWVMDDTVIVVDVSGTNKLNISGLHDFCTLNQEEVDEKIEYNLLSISSFKTLHLEVHIVKIM